MKKVFLLLFILPLLTDVFAEDADYDLVVNARGGLRMRSGASLKSKTITVIPNKAKVKVLEQKEEVLAISWTFGSWMKVQYKNDTGWVFGGFLVGPEEIEDNQSRAPIYRGMPLNYIGVRSRKDALQIINPKKSHSEMGESNICMDMHNQTMILIQPERLPPQGAPPEALEAKEFGHLSIQLDESMLPSDSDISSEIEYTIIRIKKDRHKNIYYMKVKRIDIIEMEHEAAEMEDCPPSAGCEGAYDPEEYGPTSYSLEDTVNDAPYTFREPKSGALYHLPKEMEIVLELRNDNTAYWRFKSTGDDIGANFLKNGYYLSEDIYNTRCMGMR